jgi:hypothetical protein
MTACGMAYVALLGVLQVQAGATREGSHAVTARESIDDAIAAEIAVTVLDGESALLPVRVVVTACDGSHPDGSGHGVYGDGRFFADGAFTVRVPPGETLVRLASGPNYVPLELALDAEAGKRLQVEARLHRWFAPEERGWYGGDNHVHAQHDPTATVKSGLEYTALQGRANGLSFVTEAGSNVSYDGLGQLSTDTFLLRYARELRPGCYAGHVNTPGIREPIPEEVLKGIMGAPLPVAAVTRAAHDLGGIAIHTHPLSPPHQFHWMGAAELLSDAVLGACADLVDVDSRHTELLWFAALNLGNRIGCSSYTDCGLGRLRTLSPGDRRVYCHPEEFTYPAIIKAMREGRTFATNGGPVFPFFTIDGHAPGDVIAIGGEAALEARVEVQSLHPLKSAVLYRNGNVAKEFDVDGKSGQTVLSHSLSETGESWYVFRVQDEQGHWAITSPVYCEPEQARPASPKAALLLEISNCTRFIQLRREFSAHVMVTVSADDRLVSVQLLRDGEPVKSFEADAGNEMGSGKMPVTQLNGEYAPGWVWHPAPAEAVHFQADWPVMETGWYWVRAMTAQGREWVSDAVHFDAANPNSHELSVARMTGPGTEFRLWGCGEEMPLVDVALPFEGDHWWYPRNTFWRIAASFDGQDRTLTGGGNREALFRAGRP